MKSNYRRLGDYIEPVKVRNSELKAKELLGININKHFMPSVANIVGTDLSNYKLVQKNQFACNRMHVGRDYRIPVAVSESEEPFIVSPAYDVFEIKDSEVLLPEYLMMWFERAEFDRNAWFYTDADVRGGLAWQAFEDMQLPVPHPNKQREIVKEYNTIQNRITLNQQLIQKLEETAQAIYREWFVEFEFPDKNGKPYKSSGGEMVWNEELEKEIPKGWNVGVLGDCIDFYNGYGFESEELLNEKLEDCYSVFKMGNIKKGGGFNIDGTKSWIEKSKCVGLKRFVLQKGDLLMCMTDMKDNIGLLGNTALMTVDNEFIVNQRVGLIRTSNEIGVSYRFLYLVTNSAAFLQDLRSRANRGVQVNLTTNEILSTRMILADFETNVKFDNILKVLFSKMDIASVDISISNKLLRLLLSKLATVE